MSTITILESVDSTNNYAMGQAHAGVAVQGQAWLALEQKRGKGQQGKEWETAKGDNITMSTVLDATTLSIQQQFRLSATIAAACHSFIKHYAVENVTIKWPNDIYWNDRKAGGILIENILQGQTWKWAIAGTGMNINQADFPEYLPNAVSLYQITGQRYAIEDLTEVLHQRILFYWQQLTGSNWELVHHYYNTYLYKKESQVHLQVDSRSMMATVKGISEEGKLQIVETDEEFEYGSVQVKWLT